MPKQSQPCQAPKGFYVYALIDPRDGLPFYIGKGKGNRYRQHVAAWRAGRVDNIQKFARIGDIFAVNQNVQVQFLGTELSESAALALERETIAKIGVAGLTNISGGGSSSGEKLYAHGVEMLNRFKTFKEWSRERRRTGCQMITYYSTIAELLDDLTMIANEFGLECRHRWPTHCGSMLAEKET